MNLIDTHCHLYLKEFEDDIEAVFNRAGKAGVKQFYLPAIDSLVINDMLFLEEKYGDRCRCMMGLHPCSVKQNFRDELLMVHDWLSKRRFAAVGEIGLDLYWDTTFYNEQVEAFKQQMEWALQFNLPVVIHTRNAMEQTIQAVEPFSKKGLTGIFHCFGDSLPVAEQIIGMGFLLGIGGVVTYKKAGLEGVLKHVDIKHIVLETDAPYLSPVPYRGKRNESSYILEVAKRVAEIKNLPLEEVAEITTSTAQKLFGY